MQFKPLKPLHHGIIDYLSSAFLLAGPKALRSNENTAATYQLMGAVFLAMNAVSHTPVAIHPVLSFKDHQKADAVFLGGLGLLGLTPLAYNSRAERVFYFGFLALAVTHYLLSDYDACSKKQKPA